MPSYTGSTPAHAQNPNYLLDHLDFGVVVLNHAGRYLYGNAGALKILAAGGGHQVRMLDEHSVNFTPGWAAIKNVLPCLVALPDNPITICWVDRSQQYREASVCSLSVDAGPNRHLMVLRNKNLGGNALLSHPERKLLQLFAECCCTLGELRPDEPHRQQAWTEVHALHGRRVSKTG